MAGVDQPSAGYTVGLSAFASAQAHLRALARSLVPTAVRRVLAQDPRDLVVTVDGTAGFSLLTPRGPQRLDGNVSVAMRRLAGPKAALTILVPPERAFVRRLTVPCAALACLDDVLALDLERTTPLKRDTVYAAHRIISNTGDVALVEHIVIKAGMVAPLIGAARGAGVPIKAIRLASEQTETLNFLPAADRSRSRVTRLLQGATGMTAVTVVIAMASALAWQSWRLEREIAEASAEQARLAVAVAASRREADATDRQLQLARYARARRMTQPLVVDLIEDLTRLLPDTTWLTDVRIDHDAISIEGRSTNAAALVALLAQSPHVATATFAAPITRDGVRGNERFQIRLARKPSERTP